MGTNPIIEMDLSVRLTLSMVFGENNSSRSNWAWNFRPPPRPHTQWHFTSSNYLNVAKYDVEKDDFHNVLVVSLDTTQRRIDAWQHTNRFHIYD